MSAVALNTARDVGSRLWAMTVWGREGRFIIANFQLECPAEIKMELAAGGGYGAVTALTNIPATIFGIVLYEIFLVDSDRGKLFEYMAGRLLIFFAISLQSLLSSTWST